MRRLAVSILILLIWVSGGGAAEFKLNNGDILRGEPSSFTDDGLIVRLDIGGFSQRIPWGKLTQDTLKSLTNNPTAAPFVEPYIEIPLEVREAARREKKKEIVVKDPPRVPLVEERVSLFPSLFNPIGFFLLGALYLANLYAGVEIARWKGRPLGLVVGVSAVAPFLGPLLFACLPSSEAPPAEMPAEAPATDTAPVNPMAHAGAPQSSLGLAGGGQPAGKAAGNPAYSQVYNRSNTTFDRRFFETKFSGFFRVVPADPEKDLVIVVKAAKAEYRAVRISRISGAEVHLQTQSNAEVSVPFAEIAEISVKPKAAK